MRRTNVSSDFSLTLDQALNSYSDKFGQTIPASVAKFAANTNRWDRLIEAMDKAVQAGSPTLDLARLTEGYVKRSEPTAAAAESTDD